MQETCNAYTLTDLQIGLTERFTVTVTQQMQDSFTNMSGDINPLHLETAAAKRRGFQDKLVYGMLTASLYSTLVGVYLPGENCLFQECRVSWPKPVYVGDTLQVVGRVTGIDQRFQRIEVKAYIENQKGERVSRAVLTVGVLD